MIVTLTPNPSLDLLFSADRLVWDDANRLPMPRRRPGGQGINVVRAVRALAPDAKTLAIAPLGGAVGREMQDILLAEGTPLQVVPIRGETRVFVGIRERATGRALLLNPRGPAVGPGEGSEVLAVLGDSIDAARGFDSGPRAGSPRAVAGGGEASNDGGWLACCGSLLPGLAPDFYAHAGALARDRGFRFVPDCDGESLAAAVANGCDLLVPNEHEAGRLLGLRIEGADAALDAASALLLRGPSCVAVTLGAAGAVAATGTGAWHARPELPAWLANELTEGSAVGAGDVFLGALLLEFDGPGDVATALTRAVAAGTAALLSRGPHLVRPDDMTRILPYVNTEAFGTR